jgi:hypothetical protein
VTPPPAPVCFLAGYRGREGLAVGVALALVGDGTGVGASVLAGASVLVGDGTAAVALAATTAGGLHRDGLAGLGTGVALPPVGAGTGVAFLPVGLGTAVGFPPAGAGTGVARQGAEVGTAAGAAPAGLTVGVPEPFPEAVFVGVAVGAAVPAVAAAGPRGVPLAARAAGWPGPVLAELAGADAAEPEPDAADAVHPARARPAAIPTVQPTATRADLLCDRTCMLLEVVSGKETNTGKYVGTRRKLCPAGSNLSPRPSVYGQAGQDTRLARPAPVRPGHGGRAHQPREPGRPAERTE